MKAKPVVFFVAAVAIVATLLLVLRSGQVLGTSGGSASGVPPDIKKDAKVDISTDNGITPVENLVAGSYSPWATVDEVRDNWVRLTFRLNANGEKYNEEQRKRRDNRDESAEELEPISRWVNFSVVRWYYVKP